MGYCVKWNALGLEEMIGDLEKKLDDAVGMLESAAISFKWIADNAKTNEIKEYAKVCSEIANDTAIKCTKK